MMPFPILVIIFAASLLQGCQMRELISVSDEVELHIAGSYEKGSEPELYRMLAFDAEDGHLAATDFVSPEGGIINIPFGTYDIFFYNFDLDVINLTKEELWKTLYAYTSKMDETSVQNFRRCVKASYEAGTKSAATDEDTPVVYCPDYFYVAVLEDFKVPIRPKDDPVWRMDITVSDVTRSSCLKIRGIKGIEYVSGVTAYLTDAPCGYMPSIQGATDSRFVVCGSGMYYREEETVVVDYKMFDCPKGGSQETGKVSAYLYVTDIAGNTFTYSYDVTQCISEEAETTQIECMADITVEEPVIPEDGLLPTISEWIEETVPVDIGGNE